MDVLVVGGGPAGLLAAAKLSEAGFKTTLVEEHLRLGYPEHCTGIVRDDFIGLVGYKELESIVLAKYSGGYVCLELGSKPYAIETNRVKALMIDRPLYERLLGELASAAGAQMILGKRAEIFKANGSFYAKVGNEVLKPGLIIGARGPAANPNLKVIRGLQAYVSSAKRLEEDKVYVAFSSLFPDFFGWVAPFSDGFSAKVGVASSVGQLKRSLNVLSKAFLGEGYSVRAYFGGLVVVGSRGFASSFGEGNYVPIGDEAGLVKPLTGGGLDLGVFCVNELVGDLKRNGLELKRYRKWLYRTKLKILAAQLIGRGFFGSKLFGKTVLGRLLKDRDLATILRSSDFDDHVGTLFKVVSHSLSHPTLPLKALWRS